MFIWEDLLERVDIFGLPIQFSFKNNFLYKSVMGSILTVLVLGLSISIFVFFGKEIIEKKNPQTILNQQQQAYPEAFEINGYSFPIVAGIENYDTWLPIQNERIYHVNFTQFQRIKIKDNITGQDTYQNILTPLEVEPCSLSKHILNQDQKQYFNLVSLDKYYCLKFDSLKEPLKFEGYYDMEYQQQLYIDFYTCQNTSSMQNCAPQEEIDAALKKTYYNIYHTEITIDPSNHNAPIKYHQTNQYGIASNSYMKILYLDFKNIFIDSDVGLIMPVIESQKSLKLLNSKELYDNSPNNNFFHCEIQLSKKVDLYTRQYKKLQNALAEVGGIISLVIGLIYLLILPLLRLNFYQAIFNEIFVYDSDNGSSKQGANKKQTSNENNQQTIQQENQQITTDNDQLTEQQQNQNINKDINKVFNSETMNNQDIKRDQQETLNEIQYQIQQKENLGNSVLMVQTVDDKSQNSNDNLITFLNNGEIQKQPKEFIKSHFQNSGTNNEVQNKAVIKKRQHRPSLLNELFPKSKLKKKTQASSNQLNFQTKMIQIRKKIWNNFNKQKGGLVLQPFDYIAYYFPFGCKRRKIQIQQILHKIKVRFDSIYINNKLLELDKLKSLLLDQNQRKLFNMISRPIVSFNSQGSFYRHPNYIEETEQNEEDEALVDEDNDGQQSGTERLDNNEYRKISEQVIQRAFQSFEAYKSIKEKQKLNPLDIQLIKTMDNNVKILFEEMHQEENKIIEDYHEVDSKQNQSPKGQNCQTDVEILTKEAQVFFIKSKQNSLNDENK